MAIDITQLVPNFLLGDKNGFALAKAIETAMSFFCEKTQEAIDMALNPEKMPEWRLDEVAREMNITWYDFNAEIKAKREIIKTARKTYSTLGTKDGTQSAARGYSDDANIEEWFDYGGSVGHFRITSHKEDAAFNAVAMAKGVNNVKRLGAVLDGIYIALPAMKSQLYAGAALQLLSQNQFRMASVDMDALGYSLLDEGGILLLDEESNVLFDER